MPTKQITLGTPSAITLSSRRLDGEGEEAVAVDSAAAGGADGIDADGTDSTRELRQLDTHADTHADVEASTQAESSRQERDLLSFNPQPLPSTTVSYPFTIVAFSSQGTVSE